MGRWEILQQQSGITDTMKINILSTLRTTIDIHGSSNKTKICTELQSWLITTYGKVWAVIIADTSTYSYSVNPYDNKYLLVRETDLKWDIAVFQQIP
ncbi:unnamed protein product [Adineta ricciae]|uniref:Uncharacterized protein n=1 Tax=Adineta ricciae TaxID=249248 RepID=A0A814Q6G8_ADIRI|nr:unnamed protein product [Adineta ricciae]